MTEASGYLRTGEAAAHLGLSARTLERYRGSGGGPPFHLFRTAVRYLRCDLDEWARTRRLRSISDGGKGSVPGGRPGPAGAGR